jgi:hypothetical protein
MAQGGRQAGKCWDKSELKRRMCHLTERENAGYATGSSIRGGACPASWRHGIALLGTILDDDKCPPTPLYEK